MLAPIRNCERSLNAQLVLGVESLEHRRMLAGNVSATINSSGDLVIRGDSADNEMLVSVDSSGNVQIESIDGTTDFDRGNLATSRMTGDIRIDTLGGADRVELTATGLPPVDQVTIRMGSGDDYLRVRNFESDESINVNLGVGNDEFLVLEVVSSGMQIQSGGGDDSLNLATLFPGELSANLGGGSDAFLLEESAGQLRLNAGGGDDIVGLTDISPLEAIVRTAGGGDSIELNYVNGTNIELVTAGGDDEVRVEQSDVTGELKVNTGAGDNNVDFKYAEVANARVNTGGGADYSGAHQSQMNQFELGLGGGADFASLFALDGTVTANGGGGLDGLRVVEGSNLELDVQSIEELT